MKKYSMAFLVIFSLIAIFSSEAFAVASPDISVVVNDAKINFSDAQPFVDSNGRTQTPAKYIGEALGATVTWDGISKEASFIFGDKFVVLHIGKKTYEVNGETKQMDTAAVIKDGRTFVPAKYIAEELGADVRWDAASNTVYLVRTLETQTQDGKDIADGTVVNNEEEVIETLKMASNTLQPEVVLKCDYKIEDLDSLLKKASEINSLSSIKMEISTMGNITDLTASIRYLDSFVLQQARKNNIASGRLTDKDIEVVNKINEILSKTVKDSMTDYQKELAIHDYLVLNCKYDYENYKNKTLPDESYTLYGLLIKGTGVCQAYAEAMEVLLNFAGVECSMVTGTANGEGHAWNIVKLDNEYYMIDTTADDPTPDKAGAVNYSYFNLTDSQLAEDHIWDKSKWPAASGTKYNYFIYNNLVVNNYNEFKQLVIKKIQEGQRDIWVYINNYDGYGYSLDFIFNYYNGDNIFHSSPTETNTPYRLVLN